MTKMPRGNGLRRLPFSSNRTQNQRLHLKDGSSHGIQDEISQIHNDWSMEMTQEPMKIGAAYHM